MAYMSRYQEIRLNPALLLPGARSMVCVAMSYAPSRKLPEKEYQIAYYAYGKDYHEVMREKLHQLASYIGATSSRVCCDTAPLMERYWAMKAGIGFIGKNRQLIIPGAGSMFFLGEILTDAVLDYDNAQTAHCQGCGRCITACPTGALSEDGIDANRCLSYHTIENRGTIPPEIAKHLQNSFYGCDRCQTVCPHNADAQPTKEPSFGPSEELLSMTKAKWKALSIEDYRRLFKGSAVKRAKYEGLMRNIRLLEENERKSCQ